MAPGFVGPAPGVVAFGIVRETWTLEGLETFEAGVRSRKGRVARVLSFDYAEANPGTVVNYEVLVVSDDKNKEVAFVKIWYGEPDTVVRYRDSKAPLGGLKLIGRKELVSFVTLENQGKEHPFIEHVIACCPTKLDALSAFPAICVESGLNNTSRAVHYLSKPVACPALEAILRAPQEAFVAASGRNLVIYHPPTLAQHTSTLALLDAHAENGTLAHVHHQKNQNSQTNSDPGAFSRQAKMTDEKAVLFACDVVRGTIKNEYGVCQNGVTAEGKGAALTSLTPMQKMKAALLSAPDNKEAIAYLTPRVGAAHVDVLQKFGRELAQSENEILALAPAASPSASKKLRV
jgi:hypothetical protein